MQTGWRHRVNPHRSRKLTPTQGHNSCLFGPLRPKLFNRQKCPNTADFILMDNSIAPSLDHRVIEFKAAYSRRRDRNREFVKGPTES